MVNETHENPPFIRHFAVQQNARFGAIMAPAFPHAGAGKISIFRPQRYIFTSSRPKPGTANFGTYNQPPRPMKHLLLFVAALITLGAPPLAPAGPKEDVAAATQAWVDAFNRRDPARILALYDPEAVFWGTGSPTLRDNPEAIRDYFKGMANQPLNRVALDEQRIRVYGEIAINTGGYTFSNVRDGKPVTRPARFSFVYRLRDGRW
ncbi:MAG: hypothetical protein A3G75_14910, partial [Verrucomicrobia bacterium RIFCSPLOWO2_12_FULL_64_8]